MSTAKTDIIKIRFSTPWSHIDFNSRVAPNPGYQYIFDDTDEPVDYWVIWGDIKPVQSTGVCPPQNIIYITDEVNEQRFYLQPFLNQFAAVITCRTDLRHAHILQHHELNTWMVQRSYQQLVAETFIEKSKKISVVSSNLTWLPGHKKRFALVNKLAGHFKDKLAVFGKGIHPVADKYDALAPYQYSIAIENSAVPGYFTEKITDCYLTHTMPVYFGCPDIDNYFDADTMLKIDVENFEGTVQQIEQLLDEDPYQQLLPLIYQQKQRYLSAYHIFNILPSLLQQHFNNRSGHVKNRIKAERCFYRGYAINQLLGKAQHLLQVPTGYRFQLQFSQHQLYSNQTLK
ncbi:MAG: hypothetical protein RL172_2478 [Bacteroidota bacterium]